MAKLIDREYPFGSERKEFKLVMRALQSGWINDEAATDLIDQAIARVLSNEHLRESLSLLRTAVNIDKLRMQLRSDTTRAELEKAKAEICNARDEVARRRRELAKPVG